MSASRVFTSGTLTIAPPSDWDLLPRTSRKRKSSPSQRRPAPRKEEMDVIVISSDDSLPEDPRLNRDVSESTRSSAQVDDLVDELELSGDTLHVPLEHQHDRLRRVIRHRSSYSFVSMRSQVEQFEIEPPGSFRCVTTVPYSYTQCSDIFFPRVSPSRHLKTNTHREGIDDACLLSNGTDSMIITGHVQDAKQISAIMLDPSSARLSSISRRIEELTQSYLSLSHLPNLTAH